MQKITESVVVVAEMMYLNIKLKTCPSMSRNNIPVEYYKQFSPKNGIPEAIYKYSKIDNYLKESLKEGYLWFSKPSDFNDPFDCYTALIDFSNPEAYIKRSLTPKLLGNRKERRAKGRELAKTPSRVSETYEKIVGIAIERMGICCFTNKNDDILMWSHYANNHKGICMVFNPYVNLSYFNTAEVRYTNKFSPISYYSNEEDALMKMCITKSMEWEYEKELRVILTENNGRQYFPKNALIGIIFGCRASETEIEEIKNIIKSSKYKSVFYKKAHTERNSFKLSINP